MPKQNRADQSRTNGAKSQGPVTEAGKKRSSQNGTTHGAYSRRIVLSFESQEAYNKLAESYRRHFQPQNQAESDVVEDMINNRWKIRRFEAIEDGLYKDSDQALQEHEGFTERETETQIADVFSRMLKKDNALESCALFLQRYQKAYSRALRNFEKLRKKPIPPNIEEEAHPAPQPVKEPKKESGKSRPELLLALILLIATALISTTIEVKAPNPSITPNPKFLPLTLGRKENTRGAPSSHDAHRKAARKLIAYS